MNEKRAERKASARSDAGNATGRTNIALTNDALDTNRYERLMEAGLCSSSNSCPNSGLCHIRARSQMPFANWRTEVRELWQPSDDNVGDQAHRDANGKRPGNSAYRSERREKEMAEVYGSEGGRNRYQKNTGKPATSTVRVFTRHQRKTILINALNGFFCPAPTPSFAFHIAGFCVCEGYWLSAMGYRSYDEHGQPKGYRNMYLNAKTSVVLDKGQSREEAKKPRENVRMQKDSEVHAFLKMYREEYCEALPTPTIGGLPKYQLPFSGVKHLFQEFIHHQQENQGAMCSLEYFRKLFCEYRFESRDKNRHGVVLAFSGCKGSFKGCTICRAVESMLVGRSPRLDAAKKQILIKYRRSHLKRQQEMRESQRLRQLKAKQSYETPTRPLLAHIYGDAIENTKVGLKPSYR